MWKDYNPNPLARRVGDCAVRAVSKALGIDWEQAYAKLAAAAYKMADMPSSDAVWGAVLRQAGFHRAAVPDTCPDCYTAEAFCRDNQEGTFVLAFGGHVATVVDGDLYDSWESSQEVPQYYFFKPEEEEKR